MGEETILDKLKDIVGSVAFVVFLWSIGRTEEEYRNDIYLQEKEYNISK